MKGYHASKKLIHSTNIIENSKHSLSQFRTNGLLLTIKAAMLSGQNVNIVQHYKQGTVEWLTLVCHPNWFV